VQFIAVLPLFILIVAGLWMFFQAYSARQTLCDAVWEASRYLQVEGPYLPEDEFPYPAGWEQLAVDIINTELKSNAVTPLALVDVSKVDITPDTPRQSPADPSQVTFDRVPDAWFFVHATSSFSSPVGVFIPDTVTGGRVELSCKATGFFEGEPVGPTPDPRGGRSPGCRPTNRQCTPGAPTPGPTPTCIRSPADQDDPCCPVCRP
jgi:hypothetical protein